MEPVEMREFVAGMSIELSEKLLESKNSVKGSAILEVRSTDKRGYQHRNLLSLMRVI